MPFCSGMKSRRAFTLVELLVVIAVLGILAGLLLPALARAKDRARIATDLNNHKQILLAAHMYCGDNGDFLPRPGWQLPFSCWAYGYPFPWGGGGTQTAYESIYPQQLQSFTNGQLYSYLTEAKILMCPGDRVDSLFYQREMYISSYVWNGAVSSFDNTSSRTHKLGEFKPGDILQWESDETAPGTFNDAVDLPSEGFTRRHGGTRTADPTRDSGSRVTIGRFDGSAAKMPGMALYQLAGGLGSSPFGPPPGTTPLPNELWCNPGSTNGTMTPF